MQIRKLIISSFKMAIRYDSCADPGIFIEGGGKGSGPSCNKKASTFFLLLFFYIFLSSNYFTEVQWLL